MIGFQTPTVRAAKLDKLTAQPGAELPTAEQILRARAVELIYKAVSDYMCTDFRYRYCDEQWLTERLKAIKQKYIEPL